MRTHAEVDFPVKSPPNEQDHTEGTWPTPMLLFSELATLLA